MEKNTLRMQFLSGVITESEYTAIINQEIEDTEKDSLNESMIGGIVGIGAINQIPSRAKADYETAFEHFLGGKYGLNEVENMEEDLNEVKDIAAIKDINDKIQNDPEFLKKTKEAMAKAEKGDTTDLASLMAGFGKMFEAEKVEEPTNY
jgi:hypothetical protein